LKNHFIACIIVSTGIFSRWIFILQAGEKINKKAGNLPAWHIE